MIRKPIFYITLLLLCFKQNSFSFVPGSELIKQNIAAKTITITVPDKKLSVIVDYSSGCVLRQLMVNGKNILSASGTYTGIQTKDSAFSSNNLSGIIKTEKTLNGIILKNIIYGSSGNEVRETWEFKVKGDKITWDISRDYNIDTELEDMAFPKWNFANLSVWKGGILDNGGMVWCKYLKGVNDTYGVHTGGVTFWNAESGDALRIAAKAGEGQNIATKYSHSAQNEFTCTQLVTDTALGQRYNLSRFVPAKADVFAPFKVKKGKTALHIELQYQDYFKTYSRGVLTGIDASSVRELLNTTGRYGVVDNNIIGGNGWTSNWKCLHEPFFAQIGMAVDDENYTHNMSSTLNQERDEAMLADGRVLSRWHNVPGDEIPGTYNLKTGYYEAMWGYTIDSQTGYVINTSEQFNLNGDVNWLKSHEKSCEKALDWLIKRDANHNDIFEMLNNNIAEKKASDWLDIVWASYENAFVNAQMYEALMHWAECEKVLGNKEKETRYAGIAARLKTAFNKPVDEGGFWSPAKKQYVYWRDNDGSVHGDNLVTPVNFAAIAFGICDDHERISQILDQIEQRAVKEHLFHWPLCFDSFKQDEVSAGNWPFPKYENGDIFPTWGYLGIRAYAGYDKNIALKYINNILEQYKKDGLSSQRYSRATQLGQGDDILAGICTSITALYRDIYGIRPKWNRMGLEPNLSKALNGTAFTYILRDIVYQIKLSVNDYEMRSKAFSVKSTERFGASRAGYQLTYFHHNLDSAKLLVNAASARSIDLQVNSWDVSKTISWTITSKDAYKFTITTLQPDVDYVVMIDNISQHIKTNEDGNLQISKICKSSTRFTIKPFK